MRYLIIALIIIFLSNSSIMLGQKKIEGGVLDKNTNSNSQDYGAYLVYGVDNDTLFFTSSREVNRELKKALNAEIFYCTRPVQSRFEEKAINEGWSKAERIRTEASRIAKYTRGSQAITSDRIIFAAERDLSTKTAEGTSYLLDLWEMTRTIKGFSEPTPLVNVNSPDAWDSQPAISGDGNILYFVSNRPGGKGGLDIWYSVKSRGNWQPPVLVPNINTPGNEFSPHCGTDGKFYFSTDWNYSENRLGKTKKDIYRAEFKEHNSVLLPFNPVELDLAIAYDAKVYGIELPEGLKYNSEADDEFPFISPDRRTIFFSSNRASEFKERNIFAYSLPKSKIKLIVKVKEQLFDTQGNQLSAPSYKSGLALELEDNYLNSSREILSGETYEIEPAKSYRINLSKLVEEDCYTNKIEGGDELTLTTIRPFGPDTTYIREFLISRKKVEIEPIIFHSTDSLPYFITGYWYPNTTENYKTYVARESSGFFAKAGYVDSTGHDYYLKSLQIDSIFNERIYKPLEEILPNFQDFCRDTLYLKVTIHGYTDPRGLSGGEEHPYRPQSRNQRYYPDASVTVGVDQNGNAVNIESGMNMWNYTWTTDNSDGTKNKIILPDEGEKGNVILSKLRAYYTFVTFDQAMSNRSSIYSFIKDNGKVLIDAEGFGIDKEGLNERNLRDDPMSRRIEIYIDLLRPEELSTHKRLKGGSLKSFDKSNNIAKDYKVALPEEEIASTQDQKITTKVTERVNRSDNEVVEELVDPPAMKEPNNSVRTIEKSEGVDVVGSLPPASGGYPEDYANCYSLQYNLYDSETEANSALAILLKNNVSEARLLPIIDEFGNSRYRLRSGCFDTTELASQEVMNNRYIVEKLGLKKKPDIVR